MDHKQNGLNLMAKERERVALTAWEERISPVFDSSRSLYIAHLSGGEIIETSLEPFNPEVRWHLVDLLKNFQIDTLICGAVPGRVSNIITSCGVELIPFISGRIDEILDLYRKKNRIPIDFLMPGCGRRCRSRFCESHMRKPAEEVMTMMQRQLGDSSNDGDRVIASDTAMHENRRSRKGGNCQTNPNGRGQGKRKDGSGQGKRRDGSGSGQGPKQGQGQGRKKGSGQSAGIKQGRGKGICRNDG